MDLSPLLLTGGYITLLKKLSAYLVSQHKVNFKSNYNKF